MDSALFVEQFVEQKQDLVNFLAGQKCNEETVPLVGPVGHVTGMLTFRSEQQKHLL